MDTFEIAKRELRFLVPESDLPVDFLISNVIKTNITLSYSDKKESRFLFANNFDSTTSRIESPIIMSSNSLLVKSF